MQSNSPRQLAGMLALAALLALGLAGCGGDEPAPVTAPAPAPAPAPPPFEPQSVEVALGSSGENVTLMTTEGGGFTLNGETVASGAEVMTEGGATYTLTLADGAWSAAFMPMAIEIPLGMSGDSVTVMTAEGGGVTLDGEPVTADTRVMADNGATYQAGALPDGTLGAVYVPDTATVALGMHGGSVTLSLQEDRATWTDAGGAAVASGTMVMGNGRSYTLTLDGMEWSAAYDAVTATVALGASGASAVLTQAEDGSWWLGGGAFASGGTTTAGGNAYVLTLAGGVWSAAYSPSSMPIAGTGLTAVMNEDGSGYDIAGATLPASGMGDVTVDGGMFHVWMMDGALMGARYDLQRNDGTDLAVGDIDAVMAHLADDADTDANEALTKLRLEGHSDRTLAFPFGELLDGGSSSMMDHNFVAEARKRIAEARDTVASLLGIESPISGLNTALTKLWGEVDDELAKAFGMAGVIGSKPFDNDNILPMLDEVLDALASADALAAAAEEDGDGVLEMLELTADEAADQFAAHRSEATASFGVAGATRYGALAEMTRTDAGAKAKVSLPMPTTTYTHQLVGVGSTKDVGTMAALTGFGPDGRPSSEVTTNAPTFAVYSDEAGAAEPTPEEIAMQLQTMIQETIQEAGTYPRAVVTVERSGGPYPTVTNEENGTVKYQRYGVRVYYSGVVDDPRTANEVYALWLRPKRVDNEDPGQRHGTLGAFGYSTVDRTARTRYVQTQGNAYYMGGTRAADSDGGMYAGDIEIQVRFRSERVSGVVSNLVSMEDGEAWTYQFGEVDSIVLPDAKLHPGARWTTSDGTAQVIFATRAGSPLAQRIAGSTFEGILSGTEDDAGMYASGTWSTGRRGESVYLAGGFGAVRTADEAPARPGIDDGATVETLVERGYASAMIDDETGLLHVTLTNVNEYSTAEVEDDETKTSISLSLATVLSKGGDEHTQNGTKYTDMARAEFEEIRDDLATLLSLGPDYATEARERWDEFVGIVGGEDNSDDTATPPTADTAKGLLFTGLGNELGRYTYSAAEGEDALELIDEAIAALASADAFADALAKDDPDTTVDESGFFDGAKATGTPVAATFNRRDFQVKARMGSTDYTRFGVWWARGAAAAETGYNRKGFPKGLGLDSAKEAWAGDFAYSQLDQTTYGSTTATILDPSYPAGGNATYRGETIAMQRGTKPDEPCCVPAGGMSYYSADVEANVSWNPADIGGTMSLVISNFENMATGDPLTEHVDSPEDAIREIAISGLGVSVDDMTSKLSFGVVETTDVPTQLRFGYVDRSRGETLIGELFDDAASPILVAEGVFVGKGNDGPIGVIGRWGVHTSLIGSGQPIVGAFGAEMDP